MEAVRVKEKKMKKQGNEGAGELRAGKKKGEGGTVFRKSQRKLEKKGKGGKKGTRRLGIKSW